MNGDFLTFKYTVNDSNLDTVIYDDFQYSWNPHLPSLFLFSLSSTLLFSPPFANFELRMTLWSILNDPSFTLVYIYIYIYIQIQYYRTYFKDYHVLYIYIYMCVCVCVCISALYILLAPESYTGHWLYFFVCTTGNEYYLILSYLILSYLNELMGSKMASDHPMYHHARKLMQPQYI